MEMAPRSTPPGALPNPSPSSATTPVPATTRPPVPLPSSPRAPRTTSLSPEALPFVPSGRSKAQRWQDSTPSVSDGEVSPPRASYRDALLSRPAMSHQPPAAPPAATIAPPRHHPPLRSIVGFCNLRPARIDKDGWRLVECKRSRRRPAPQTRRRHHPRRNVLEDLRGMCFNCFSR
jgi:hypothetical protein